MAAEEDPSSQTDVFSNAGIAIELKVPPSTLADASELTICLIKQSMVPSDSDLAERNTALDLLKEVMLHGEGAEIRGRSLFAMAPVGSYGLGVWDATSSIDCLFVGHATPKTLFTVAVQRLHKAASKGVKILGQQIITGVRDELILKLQVHNIKIKLQYCRLSSVSMAEPWPALESLSSDDPILKQPTLPKLDAFAIGPLRDVSYLRHTLPDLSAFQVAHHFIKCWAKRRGIYAAKYGYLGGFQISILLAVVCKALSRKTEPVSVPTILMTFFDYYASFDWKNNFVYDPESGHQPTDPPSRYKPMSILAFHSPYRNTTKDVTVPTSHVISEEFKRASNMLSQAGMTWSRFLDEGADAVEFLSYSTSYIKIDVQFWNVSLARGNSFLGCVESSLASVFIDLCRKLPEVNPRIWPARFIKEVTEDGEKHELKEVDEERASFEGYYLIKLDLKQMSGEEATAAFTQIQSQMKRFENQVTEECEHYDSKFCWISTAIVPQPSLGKLRADVRDWSKYTIAAKYDELRHADGSLMDEESSLPDETTPAPRRTTKRNKSDASSLPGNAPPDINQISHDMTEARFRTAGGLLNRLRWDQAIDSSDYVVGYNDRFRGVVEMPVNEWKSETTHEEFIPEHRIHYFKRKSDGVKIWDKISRVDNLSGGD